MPVDRDPPTVLQRVLVLERQQGFQDRAAVGGLSLFARQQLERSTLQSRPLVARIAEQLSGYSSEDRRGREASVAEALRTLLGGTPQSASVVVVERTPNPDVGGSMTALAAAPERTVPVPRPKLSIVHAPQELDNPIAALKGMRKPMREPLERLGVRTIRDLLYFLPRAHYDYTDTRSISRLRLGVRTTLVGTIAGVRNNRTSRGTIITTAAITDDTGSVGVRWFNQPYISKYLPVGARVAISGEPDIFQGVIVFQPRDYELIEEAELTHTSRLVPVYPLTKGLYQRSLRKQIRSTLEEYSTAVEDYLPSELTIDLQLPVLADALERFHFPADEEQRASAQQRLAFDELLLIQLGLLMRKRQWQQESPAVVVAVNQALHDRFCRSLAFELTRAQQKVSAELLRDMERTIPMSRLVQGDVGSGKTVVAAAALLQAVQAGKQGVLMAPTEILAEQHHRTLQHLLGPFDVRCELLIGSTKKAQRRELYQAAADGSAHVLVGTHALIQESVEFANLGLAVTDEQHRFGVEQRATLRQKGITPHILAMTATPIPRTLAMTIYGDLDVSVIDEMPPGRLPIVTTWCRTPIEAYGVVRAEVREGHQAFVICPVIEESADTDMRSVLAEHKELSALIFPDLQVGLLHGKMKPTIKEATLAAFRRGEFHILVATSVVEVGIDIPNATVVVIRDAHRFGLAQLHQLRGRVGRGGDQAYCVLLSDSEGDDARERLEAVTASDNGFELAEEDLRLRGPGEFWGTRQSGLPELKVATLGDLATIQLAREAAQHLLAADPDLTSSEHELLCTRVRSFWSETADLS